MTGLKSWLSAARLRTLPLSISGIIVGTTIAVHEGYFSIVIFCLALGTTLGLQILSNFANDYGDGIKGTDNEHRVGPPRALQSGLISEKEMKQGIVLTAILTLLMAILLIYSAFGADDFWYAIIFFLLGVSAIVAAIKYTVGTNAYGYRGLGDVFVFIFFGLVAVIGTYFLYAREIYWIALLPASAIGMLSAAVLNLNNMRDRISDENSGKMTLVVKMGERKAKNYHYSLIIGAIFFIVIFSVLTSRELNNFIYILAFIPLVFHLKRVIQNKDPRKLDPELKILALSTFAIATLFGIGLII
ncbi:1,4-dihydroxy-2-naphthoate octaprenyltransferase [Gillisia sp. CAL575]|uniref:1,4-dihydroxy-2-naphthoate octaprenyltransferase n=1 Tax=Gillisia sp. CAL575 TaxID=985255 RepID=UPI00039CCB7B|nr:1,4-dihydroxy-2-naphthoate octaprenyltransferase [Gillisia sp. CAL575]